MPIYAYKCGSCGHAKDVLQKLSEAPLTVCPACGAETFAKQLTAAGFQLKGSGWYATDFRGGNKAAADADKADPSTGSGQAKPADPASSKPADAGAAPSTGSGQAKPADSGAAASTGSQVKTEGTPAPAKPAKPSKPTASPGASH
jgi:putative FmdB family regulatory protein